MILLRDAQASDLKEIERFSSVPGMYNLSSAGGQLEDRLEKSMLAFAGQVPVDQRKFVFVAEDIEKSQVVGTSMLAVQHGTEANPHYYFQVGMERRFSPQINTGFLHGTLELKIDTNGPSEIGGLVLDRDYRGRGQKLGKQLSFVRFLFMGLHRENFREEVIAELLPPFDKNNLSPLWEAVGRRFTNMQYWEADQLCQKDKEFIFSLFPEGKIYTSLLSIEARSAIGRVDKGTEPVLHMLGKIGFRYKNQVDPFDGGPHLWGKIDELLPIKNQKKYSFQGLWSGSDSLKKQGLMTSSFELNGRFRALHVEVICEGDELYLAPGQNQDLVVDLLELDFGQSVSFSF